MERVAAGVRPICDGGRGSSVGFCSANVSGLVLNKDGMWCCSPWTCGLLVRTEVCWTDYYRTVGRSKRQVSSMDFSLYLWTSFTSCVFTYLWWLLALTLRSGGISPPFTVTKWIPAGRSICLAHTKGQIFEIKLLVLARLFCLCCIYQMEFKVMQWMCLWLFLPCFTVHERQKLTFEYFRGDGIMPVILLTSQFCDLSQFGWLKRRRPFCPHRWHFSSREIPQRTVASGFESALIKPDYGVEPSREHETVQRSDCNCLLLLWDVRLRQQGEKEGSLFTHTRIDL